MGKFKTTKLITAALLSMCVYSANASNSAYDNSNITDSSERLTIKSLEGKIKFTSAPAININDSLADEKKEDEEKKKKDDKTKKVLDMLSKGDFLSKFLNFTFKQNNWQDLNPVTGVVTKILTFQRASEECNTAESCNGLLKDYVALGYSDGSIIIYQADMNESSAGFMGPLVKDPENCNVDDISGNIQTSCTFEEIPKKFSSALMFENDKDHYAVTSLTYLPDIKDSKLLGNTGMLLVGYGRSQTVTSSHSPDIFSAKYTYGKSISEKGGSLRAIAINDNEVSATASDLLKNVSNEIGDKSISNVYVVYSQDKQQEGVFNRSVITEFTGNSENPSYEVGFSIKSIAGYPVPVPTSGTLNSTWNALNPFTKDGDKQNDLKNFYGRMTEQGDGFKEIGINVNKKNPPLFLSTKSGLVFVGHHDGRMEYLASGTNAFPDAEIKAIAAASTGDLLQFTNPSSPVLFQDYNDVSNLYVSSTKGEVVLAVADSTGTFADHKIELDSDVYIKAAAKLNKETYLISSDGNIIKICVDKNDINEESIDGIDGSIKDELSNVHNVMISDDGKYLVFSTEEKVKSVADSKVYLLELDKNGTSIRSSKQIANGGFEHYLGGISFYNDNGKTAGFTVTSEKEDAVSDSIEGGSSSPKGEKIVKYGARYKYSFSDAKFSQIIENNKCEINRNYDESQDAEKDAWITKGACYQMTPFNA